MSPDPYYQRLRMLNAKHAGLLVRSNEPLASSGGVIDRYLHPVLTSEHVPLTWRYDLNKDTNPFLLERIAINSILNAGAIYWKGKFLLIPRIEGADRKSFFAVAESDNGVDGFRFWEEPIHMPETETPDTNIYDMRLVAHEDGWVYGLFCTERQDPSAGFGDTSAALAQCGIARTYDFISWERLPDLRTPSPQQRNVVLHPSFVGGKYAFYTRPQDGFVLAGKGGGIGFGLSNSMDGAFVCSETIIDPRVYHTVNELKNGLGPAPLRTYAGWLHLAHGVRATAAGLRYTLYLFLTDLNDPTRMLYKPAGYFMAPTGMERVGDVSNVLFSNGWIALPDGRVFIYYASSDTRVHVATSTIEKLLDYVIHTPPDGGRSATSVSAVQALIRRNRALLD
jgi:4-O-beta-D-mannosyl-D-glucose phosphorylase